MDDKNAPYHAHIYYQLADRVAAEALHLRLSGLKEAAGAAPILYVGQLRDRKVGPHPIPQFEIHFIKANLEAIVPIIESSGLTALVHPLTDDDVADHTSLARWIGEPIELDLAPLDPPGMNKGVARFGKTDF
ncbi:DOPA 4,5-dioxygenase [Collimonas sp. PA-H2]|uniref:DOPA 4,5-dioxygenase family protein n=1 Tax=Collimonas sp. PA-H2 TaxID=1881062 RepID=UPI000BF9C211|nr:DOPA 4,5-dioxygenase family protein [Collimonas sp. PA-H2]PFH08550.1 DOPA 4,5-dioxygenase [Collimonas sp. PA-H2]